MLRRLVNYHIKKYLKSYLFICIIGCLLTAIVFCNFWNLINVEQYLKEEVNDFSAVCSKNWASIIINGYGYSSNTEYYPWLSVKPLIDNPNINKMILSFNGSSVNLIIPDTDDLYWDYYSYKYKNRVPYGEYEINELIDPFYNRDKTNFGFNWIVITNEQLEKLDQESKMVLKDGRLVLYVPPINGYYNSSLEAGDSIIIASLSSELEYLDFMSDMRRIHLNVYPLEIGTVFNERCSLQIGNQNYYEEEKITFIVSEGTYFEKCSFLEGVESFTLSFNNKDEDTLYFVEQLASSTQNPSIFSIESFVQKEKDYKRKCFEHILPTYIIDTVLISVIFGICLFLNMNSNRKSLKLLQTMGFSNRDFERMATITLLLIVSLYFSIGVIIVTIVTFIYTSLFSYVHMIMSDLIYMILLIVFQCVIIIVVTLCLKHFIIYEIIKKETITNNE